MRTSLKASKAILAAATGGIILFAGAASVSAHASIPSDDLAAGGYGQVSIRVPHGCEGAPTNIVEVQIPDGFTSIKPQAKAGWVVETEIVALDEPIEMHGNTITERVSVIRWTGGNLADNQYDDFGISLKAPDAAGTTAEFPTIQYCGDDSVAWIGEDAPSIDIVAGSGGGHGDSDSDTGMTDMDVSGTDAAVIDAAVAEAVATAAAEQAAAIEALEAQLDGASDDDGSNSSTSPVSIIALLAGLGGLGLGAFAARKR